MRLTEAQIRRIVNEALDDYGKKNTEGLIDLMSISFREACRKFISADHSVVRDVVELLPEDEMVTEEELNQFNRMVEHICDDMIPREINSLARMARELCSSLAGEEIDENDTGWQAPSDYIASGPAERTYTFRELVVGLVNRFLKEVKDSSPGADPVETLRYADTHNLYNYLVRSQFEENWFRIWQQYKGAADLMSKKVGNINRAIRRPRLDFDPTDDLG